MMTSQPESDHSVVETCLCVCWLVVFCYFCGERAVFVCRCCFFLCCSFLKGVRRYMVVVVVVVVLGVELSQ